MAGKGRIENLRPPWKPGESGNLNGRPKERPISNRYNSHVEMPLSEKRWRELGLWKGATYADALTMGQIDAAIAGNCHAAREVREAIEGKSNQRPKPVANPLIIWVIYDDPLPKKPINIPNGVSPVPNTSQGAEKDSK